MQSDVNVDELQYKYQQSVQDKRKRSGGTGQYYDIPTGITKAQLPSSVAGISKAIYTEIDRLIDLTITKGNAVLSKSDMPIKDFISNMYNVSALTQVEVNSLVNTELTHPVYGVGQILAFSRRSFECYDIAGHSEIENMELDDSVLQPYMHRAFRLYYNSTLDEISKTLVNIGQADDTDTEAQQKRMRNALIWLVKRNLPIGTVQSLIGSQISHYQNLLLGQIYKSINLVNHYMRLYPNIVRDGLYMAKQYALMPFYRFIHKLPDFPPNVDEVLMDIMICAEKTSNDTINNIQDMLKLSEYEKFLTDNHTALLNQVNKYFNMQNMLNNIGQLIQDDSVDTSVMSYTDVNPDIRSA